MSLRLELLVRLLTLTLITIQAFAQSTPLSWTAELFAAKNAFTTGMYDIAAQHYTVALAKADESGATAETVMPILKPLAVALRSNSDPAGAQKVVERMLTMTKEAHGASSLEVASLLTELSMVQRAQDLRKEASESIAKAIQIRMPAGLSEALAKDATFAGTIWREMGDTKAARNYYEMALALWVAQPESGMQVLTALDPLAGIYRDEAVYTNAIELYKWALRLCEAALGPDDPELISTLDSLAYCLFGLKKYDEAEPMYTRVLELWETSGGPDHPMVALTLDKMVEFYMDQKRRDAATPLAERAFAIRSRQLLESMHRQGRLLAGLNKTEEALNHYERAVRIAADTRIPDEIIPGTLRAYAILLRQKQRTKQADAMEKRVKEALERKAAKDGRKPEAAKTP